MAPPRSQNRRQDNKDAARMRMDSFRGHNNNNFNNNQRHARGGFRRNNNNRNNNRRVAESPRRRELIQHARRDTQSSYWTKRLLEVEEKEPNRWRHSGFKEMYRDELKGGSSASGKSRSSHSRSPIARPKSPVEKRPRSPPVRHDRRRPRSPPSPPSKRHVSRGRPRTPKRSCSRHRSESVSSSETISSCSDDSCSVCSPKPKSRARSPSPKSPPRKKQATRKIAMSKRSHRKSPPPLRKKKSGPKSPPQPHTPDSTSETTSSSSDSETSSDDNCEQHKLSLSERFGKMAQWSVDRKEYDCIKMKITKDDSAPGMKVVIENDAEFPQFERPAAVVQSASPERDYAFHYERRRYFFERTFTHDRPATGTDVPLNWEDPVNRYSYYKTKGLLWETDVSFDEYIKWENWWERFQEWLDVEKTYYGEDTALDNARRERERDWESYRTSNMGRTIFDRELLPLPRNQPWNRPSVRGRIGPRPRKFV